VHEFLNLVSVLAFDRTAGDCAAMVRGTMAKHGRTAGDFDEAIAGHALSHKLIMVSKDGDFIDAIATLIPGMQVEPWLSPDDDAKRKRKPR
jgi:predicted nucleic acid-binding protein